MGLDMKTIWNSNIASQRLLYRRMGRAYLHRSTLADLRIPILATGATVPIGIENSDWLEGPSSNNFRYF